MRRSRGETLVELLVATSLLGLMLTTLLATWKMLDRVSGSQAALREVRQQARTMLDVLVSDIQTAALIWTGTNNVNGHVYQVPAAGPAPPASGTDLLYALPEANAAGLLAAGTVTYTVVGVYLRPMSPPDPQNPGAQEVLCERWSGVSPARPDVPAGIDLSRLSAGQPGYSSRTFKPYLSAANWLSVLSPPRAVYFDVTFFRVPERGPVQSEHLATQATMRNGN